MARPTRELILALRETAARIASGARYNWAHMGSCNCGHLAQTLTKLPKAEIHARAIEKAGDWSEQAVEHCSTSGYPMDHILSTMLQAGLDAQDIADLEKLANPSVLRAMGERGRRADYRRRDDVVAYMRAWADAMEAEMPTSEGTSRQARTEFAGRRAA